MTQNHWQPGKGTYPMHFLISLFNDRAGAELAIQNLKEAGFAEDDIVAFHGQEDYDAILKGDKKSKFQQILFYMQEAVAEAPTSRQTYLAGLRQGQSNVLVYAPNDELKERAQSILKAAQGYRMTYLGRWTIEALH